MALKRREIAADKVPEDDFDDMEIADEQPTVKPDEATADAVEPEAPATKPEDDEPEDEFAQGLAELSAGVQPRDADEAVSAKSPEPTSEAPTSDVTGNDAGEAGGDKGDKEDPEEDVDLRAEAANDDFQKAAQSVAGQTHQKSQERQQHHGAYGNVGPISALFGRLGKRIAPNQGMSNSEIAAKKYFQEREKRIPNNLNALDRQADKVADSVKAYNKSILGNDKLKVLQGTAEMKGLTLSEYVGQLQANPSSDPTGSNILNEVLKDPSVRSKRTSMHAELEKATTLSDRINQDISDLSSKSQFAVDPQKLQGELDFMARREADIAEKMAKNTPEPVSKSKEDEEFSKRMKELMENMRNMVVRLAEKVASVIGAGPKAG